ncbi:MAG: hypothetical protein AB1782_13435 [Cyanobacteriota bacterium]
MKYTSTKQIISLIFLVFLFSLGHAVFADTIELLSGEIIEGKVISVNTTIIVIHKKPDKIKINRNKVKQIIFTDENTNTIVKKADSTKIASNNNSKNTITKTKTTDKPVNKTADKPDNKTTDKPDNKTADKPNNLKPLNTEVKEISPQEPTTKPQNKPMLRPKITINPDNNITEPAKTNNNNDNTLKIQPKTPQNNNIVSNAPQNNKVTNLVKDNLNTKKITNIPSIDYLTFINGSSTGKTYLGIYSNAPENNNLTIYLPENTPSNLSFNLHAQKNGKVPPLYTATSMVFIDKNGQIISKTNPIVIENDNFIEWFKNLENIAGITGSKNVNIPIPSNTYIVKILGYRPASKNNLVGYISNITLDNTPIKNINKI